MTSNLPLRENWGNNKTYDLNEAEMVSFKNGGSALVYPWLSDKKSTAEMMKDVYLFPNIMSDDLAARVPPVVLVTAEFDFLRYHVREARDLYKRNGKLIAYIEYGGGYHASYNNFDMKQSDVWFEDFRKLTEYWL